MRPNTIGAPRFELGRYTPSITLLGADIAGISGDNDGASEARPERLNTHAASGSGRRVDAERPRWSSGGTESARRRRGKQPLGVIYFVQAAGEPMAPVKIGYCASERGMKKRLAELQIGSPWELTVIATIGGTYEAERQIHQRFAPARLRGEWFTMTVPLSDYLEELGA